MFKSPSKPSIIPQKTAPMKYNFLCSVPQWQYSSIGLCSQSGSYNKRAFPMQTGHHYSWSMVQLRPWISGNSHPYDCVPRTSDLLQYCQHEAVHKRQVSSPMFQPALWLHTSFVKSLQVPSLDLPWGSPWSLWDGNPWEHLQQSWGWLRRVPSYSGHQDIHTWPKTRGAVSEVSGKRHAISKGL